MSSISRYNLVTQVRLDLREVMENLKILEDPDELDQQKLQVLKEKTQKLLVGLESKPLEKVKLKIKKQQIRRQRKKFHHSKQTRASAPLLQELNHSIKTENLTQHIPPTRDDINTFHAKNHHHLRSLKECHRSLKTFELLEQLHLARGQDPSETRKFSCKLQQLKTVWNCLLQEQQGEQFTSEQHIQQQWNQALFGAQEKSYFEGKPNMKYFLRKRHIWDSFIDNRNGSSIPKGWVLPPATANNEWSEYLARE